MSKITVEKPIVYYPVLRPWYWLLDRVTPVWLAIAGQPREVENGIVRLASRRRRTVRLIFNLVVLILRWTFIAVFSIGMIVTLIVFSFLSGKNKLLNHKPGRKR